MKAMQLQALGTPLVLVEAPEPEPGEGEVQLRVQACGLNFADTLMVDGKYQERPALPFSPGLEVCGIVSRLGAGVEALAIGDRVACLCDSGGLAEAVCVPARACTPVPEGMADAVAAGFIIAYGTSHVALAHLARLRPGETLLVTGASGGVGLTAVELGHLMGAEVIAVARGPEKQAIAAKAGAVLTLDPDDDIVAAVKARGGAHVVYDTVGGKLFDACLSAVRQGGRLVPIGFAGGAVPQIPANRLLVKNLTVFGLYYGGWVRLQPVEARATLAALFAWHRAGRLSPHVSHVLALDEANAGLDLLRSREATGKVIIRVA